MIKSCLILFISIEIGVIVVSSHFEQKQYDEYYPSTLPALKIISLTAKFVAMVNHGC